MSNIVYVHLDEIKCMRDVSMTKMVKNSLYLMQEHRPSSQETAWLLLKLYEHLGYHDLGTLALTSLACPSDEGGGSIFLLCQ